ncbi:hypothetical protein GEMRC1_001992 [Eukaryota sp. GEM-RC1]
MSSDDLSCHVYWFIINLINQSGVIGARTFIDTFYSSFIKEDDLSTMSFVTNLLVKTKNQRVIQASLQHVLSNCPSKFETSNLCLFLDNLLHFCLFVDHSFIISLNHDYFGMLCKTITTFESNEPTSVEVSQFQGIIDRDFDPLETIPSNPVKLFSSFLYSLVSSKYVALDQGLIAGSLTRHLIAVIESQAHDFLRIDRLLVSFFLFLKRISALDVEINSLLSRLCHVHIKTLSEKGPFVNSILFLIYSQLIVLVRDPSLNLEFVRSIVSFTYLILQKYSGMFCNYSCYRLLASLKTVNVETRELIESFVLFLANLNNVAKFSNIMSALSSPNILNFSQFSLLQDPVQPKPSKPSTFTPFQWTALIQSFSEGQIEPSQNHKEHVSTDSILVQISHEIEDEIEEDVTESLMVKIRDVLASKSIAVESTLDVETLDVPDFEGKSLEEALDFFNSCFKT